jgi:hypothetical protein
MILVTLHESGGQMESDQLDAVVAAEAAVAAKTVKNLRSELRGKGWLRSIPEKDGEGEIRRWHVALTNAAPDPRARAGEWNSRDLDYLSQIRDPDPDIPGTREPGSGSAQNGFTPEQLAAVEAYFREHGDEHGRI